MNNESKQSPVIWAFSLALLLAYLTVACKPSDPFVYTPISGETVIDTREQEIVFEKPFKTKKQVLKICFEYSDKLLVSSISESPQFADGTPLKLTASIIDQNGKKYELTRIANSVENYLCISPELTDEWMNISKRDVAFIKLFVYSNRKINVSKIKWVSFNMWDI